MYPPRDKPETAADVLRSCITQERERLEDARLQLSELQAHFEKRSGALTNSITCSEASIAAWEAAVAQLDPSPLTEQKAAA